jgi:hypothetical protein
MLVAEAAEAGAWRHCFGEVCLATWVVDQAGTEVEAVGVVVVSAAIVVVALAEGLVVAGVLAEVVLEAVGESNLIGPISPIGPISSTFLILFVDL